jgi:hypothetical protein
MSARLALSFLFTALLVLPASASAATKHGITPLMPKAGTSVPAGRTATFKVRVKGNGPVFIHLCKVKKKNKNGVLCPKEPLGRAKKKGTSYGYTSKFVDFPAFWLNNPGTYYWQAHRVACEGSLSDCRQEGPIVKFRVAG